MTKGARRYLFVLVAGILFLVCTELAPRRYRGIGSRDLAKLRGQAWLDTVAAEERMVEEPVGADELDRLLAKFAELRTESGIRHGQTGVVLALGVLSLFQTMFGVRAALRSRGALRSGLVEVMEDQEARISDDQLPAELGRLLPTRRRALRAVREASPPVCGYCGTSIPMKVIGRVGRRILLRRPPDGAKDLALTLAQGWWFAQAEIPPCPKCGATS